MKHITCPPNRRATLTNQHLNRAREIIRQRADHSAGTVVIATRTIASLSPHPYEATCAKAALASIKVAA